MTVLSVDAPLASAAPSVSRHSGTVRPSEPAIVFEQLSKSYDVRRTLGAMVRAPFGRALPRVRGLVDVSGDVHEGELFGLLGPNGAGKTTLFRILATHLMPDSGRAAIAGHDVASDQRAVRALLSCVTANERAMNWRLSARENLRLFADLHAVPKADVARRIADTLAIVELTEAADRPVGGLSSGMRQRVLLARALVARPRVLLLDEPTRSLDPLSARSLRTFIRDEVVRRAGCTVVVATHDSDEAFTWCDRVSVMHEGRILATDRADVLAHRFGAAVMGVWTSDPNDVAFDMLVTLGLVHEVRRQAASTDGWWCVHLHMPNGFEASAAVHQYLGQQQVPVARFERVDRSLADLIDRVVLAKPLNAGAP